MEFLLTGIFSILALVFVAYPLMNRKKYSFDLGGLFESDIDILRAKKVVAEDNLRELEAEHEMGKLSDGDFETLRERLKTESDRVAGEIENNKIKSEIDEMIEREVKSRRRTETAE